MQFVNVPQPTASSHENSWRPAVVRLNMVDTLTCRGERRAGEISFYRQQTTVCWKADAKVLWHEVLQQPAISRHCTSAQQTASIFHFQGGLYILNSPPSQGPRTNSRTLKCLFALSCAASLFSSSAFVPPPHGIPHLPG